MHGADHEMGRRAGTESIILEAVWMVIRLKLGALRDGAPQRPRRKDRIEEDTAA